MTLILEDLDQISKMEADQIKLDLSSFDIKKLIAEVYEAIEFKAKKRKLNLNFRNTSTLYLFLEIEVKLPRYL